MSNLLPRITNVYCLNFPQTDILTKTFFPPVTRVYILCFWTVVLEKTLESPLDCKEIQPVNAKGNQSWILIGRTNAEAETPILWPSDAKNWLIWKDPDAGREWRQWEKRMTENEMVGWHHQLDGHEFEQAPRVGDRQGSLLCCSPWGYKESGTTEQLKRYILFSLLKSSFTLVPLLLLLLLLLFYFSVFRSIL